MDYSKYKIAIIGLGYVGLPLAVEFSKYYDTVGFDINDERVKELKAGNDYTLEVELDALLNAQKLSITCNETELSDSNIFIVTVPTPVDKHNNPNLLPIESATKTVAKYLKKGDIVIYESTVYPGVTEEICANLLETFSSLKYNIDFFCGYSPERINPGDKNHTLTKIRKITSGSTPEASEKVDNLYQSIITAGTYKASSIKVAEAAKVIENAQRDINIAFVNELAVIFNLLNIDTKEVLEAAATKWNFINFKPGLVGGHCIGVDPFYLAQKAKEVGYHPEILLSGRRLNDKMGEYVAQQFIKILIKNDIKVKSAKVLILGLTFKENCPDVRNSKVIDIINELKNYEIDIDIYDPWVIANQVKREYGLNMKTNIDDINEYSGILVAVGHDIFRTLDFRPGMIVYDVKGIFDKEKVNGRL
jgi:UDP-N-acetyl-D-galactosamine dehydrogenase